MFEVKFYFSKNWRSVALSLLFNFKPQSNHGKMHIVSYSGFYSNDLTGQEKIVIC